MPKRNYHFQSSKHLIPLGLIQVTQLSVCVISNLSLTPGIKRKIIWLYLSFLLNIGPWAYRLFSWNLATNFLLHVFNVHIFQQLIFRESNLILNMKCFCCPNRNKLFVMTIKILFQ